MILDKALYAFVYDTAIDVCKKKGLDKSTAQDITHDTCSDWLDILADQKKLDGILNHNAYIKGIIVNKTYQELARIKKYFLVEDETDQIFDKFDNADGDILNNQARNFSSLIDDEIKNKPSLLSDNSKKLWHLFKEQKYSTAEMMEMMGIKNKNTFYSAKRRLIQRIIIIYSSLGSRN